MLRFDKIHSFIIPIYTIDVKDTVEILGWGDFLDGIFIRQALEYSGVIQMMILKKDNEIIELRVKKEDMLVAIPIRMEN